MGRRKTKLAVSAAKRVELLRRLHSAADAHSQERLRVVFWAADGCHTLDDLARLAGRSRSTIQVWLDKFAEGGLDGLLERDTPPGSTSPIGGAKIQAQLQAGIKAGRWRTATEVAAWLKDTHGIKRSRKSVYYWLNKGGSLISGMVPSPRPKTGKHGRKAR